MELKLTKEEQAEALKAQQRVYYMTSRSNVPSTSSILPKQKIKSYADYVREDKTMTEEEKRILH